MGLSKLKIAVVAILALNLIACAGNMESYNDLVDTSNKAASTPIVVDEGVSEKTQTLIAEVNAGEQTTNKLFADIEDQEKKMKVMNVLSFLLALPFKTTNDDATLQKIKNPITSVLNKVLAVVDKAYTLDDNLRLKLEEIASQLNPEIPSHQKALVKIDELHIKLNSFEDKLDNISERLKEGADKILLKIKLKKATYTIIDPRRWLLSKAQEYFDEFKIDMDQLML